MPHIKQLFSDMAEIELVDGRHINRQHLLEADALLCRSITRVDEELLAGTRVQFVGTATIGTDHLDLQWLNSNQIVWKNAAGCNADAVAQYVLSAMSFWLSKGELGELAALKVGIVGAGNVGTALARCLDSLGVNYLLCDPPLQAAGDPRPMVDLAQTLACDVITIHVPLTKEGCDKTFHLIDRRNLSQLNSQQLLINASRGAVINNQDLVTYLKSPNSAAVVLDVFENEPDIDFELVHSCLLATPHIAGHSLEGKSRGSYMIYRAFCRHFDIECKVKESALYPASITPDARMGFTRELSALLTIYDIMADDQRLKKISVEQLEQQFDQLRKNYPEETRDFVRRDFSGWLTSASLPNSIQKLIEMSKS